MTDTLSNLVMFIFSFHCSSHLQRVVVRICVYLSGCIVTKIIIRYYYVVLMHIVLYVYTCLCGEQLDLVL